MPDGKKKRPRKRQRKRTLGGNTGQEEEEDNRPNEEAEGEEDEEELSHAENKSNGASSVIASKNSQSRILDDKEIAKHTPSLSFYQRTNPHKPSALAALHGNAPRRYTISVAIPGSIIMNAQSPELQSRLAGQLARSCAIFNIDEIVVFNDGETIVNASRPNFEVAAFGDDQNDNGPFDPNAFLARILQYVETPQYLRKSLFPMHRDLRMAGILAPLDCPHHLRFEEDSPYREGVCVEAPHWATDKRSTWVFTGFRDPIECKIIGQTSGAQAVPLGARVTVKMPEVGKKIGYIVSPREPTQERGLYWGYTTRLCNSLSEAISLPCWNEAYDLIIGTSERGTSLTEVIQATISESSSSPSSSSLSSFKHALIMFGGLSGLEVAVEKDININLSADDASELFDAWINVVEGQGSRTIRTEEALLITLSRLKTTLESLGQR